MEDVSFFLGCLSNYLRENNFYIGFDFSSFERVKSDAALAEEAFETYRKRGYSLDQAMELTMNDLFANVGESRHQAIETCLIGILGIHDLTEVEEEFVQKTAIQAKNRLTCHICIMLYASQLSASQILKFGLRLTL